MAKDIYKNNWVKGDKIGKGGQALTYHAKRAIDDGATYALKILKDQTQLDRRERMLVEVSALRTLRHEHIPAFIDSNADQFTDLSVSLFLVTEYIPGPTLEDFITLNGPMKLPDAIAFALCLSNILEYCHDKGFWHRDIKPDNIIVREGRIDHPYLIDFGLSFNEEIPKSETPSWEHIGNRFLALPELRVREGNKKDARSDVTMLWGILLYTLTGIPPTDLLDEKNDKPHQRGRSKGIIGSFPPNIRDALNKMFDIAFNLGINTRWQSVQSTKMVLVDLQNLKPSEMNSESDINKRLEDFKKKMEESLEYKQFGMLKQIFKECFDILNEATRAVLERLPKDAYTPASSGYGTDYKNQSFAYMLGFRNIYKDDLTFFPKFTCYTTGSEIVLEALEAGNRTELLRGPLAVETDWQAVRDKIIDYFMSGVLSKEKH